MKRKLSFFLILVLMLSLLAGCGAVERESMSMTETAPAAKPQSPAMDYGEWAADDEAVSEAGTGATGVEVTVMPENQKLIRTVYVDAETLDMDPLMAWIEGRVAELGGYFEEKSIRRSGSRDDGSYYRYADLMIRVPVEHLDSFLSQVGQSANITSTSETTENVTLTYVATQSRVTALETEQKRLLELLESAETMEDLLTIEARLTDVRWELENYASQLRVLDNQVDYGTLYLNIHEVDAPTVMAERSVWQKIGDGFVKNAGNMWDGLVTIFVWVLTMIPYLLPPAVIAGVILLVIALLRKKKKGKKPTQNP